MFWFTAAHPETGEPLEVEAEYSRPYRGRRDEFGEPMEPDEPESVHILKIRGCNGYLVDYESIISDIEADAWCFLAHEM